VIRPLHPRPNHPPTPNREKLPLGKDETVNTKPTLEVHLRYANFVSPLNPPRPPGRPSTVSASAAAQCWAHGIRHDFGQHSDPWGCRVVAGVATGALRVARQKTGLWHKGNTMRTLTQAPSWGAATMPGLRLSHELPPLRPKEVGDGPQRSRNGTGGYFRCNALLRVSLLTRAGGCPYRCGVSVCVTPK
jgi:hypothetical protein